jgi:phosphopantetheinyl transferase (holo-ACP synthase)
VRLTSGQQARAGGWLVEHGITFADLRSRLSTSFQPSSLLDDAGPAVQSFPPPQSQRPKIDGAPVNLRIGIDIQRIDELLPVDPGLDLKASSEVTAIFTMKEISYAQSRPTPLETLGGLFAAKEALRKCDAALLALPLLDVEVLPGVSGQPQFPGFTLSISHSGGFAIAVAAVQRVLGPPPSPATPSPMPLQMASPPSMRRFIVKTAIVTAAVLVGLLSLQWLGSFRFL